MKVLFVVIGKSLGNNSLLIKNADFIVTMDNRRRIIKNGNIYIEKPKIISVGKNIEVSYSADRVIDARGKIAIPGLINTHHHLSQTLTRVIPVAQNVSLFPWLLSLYDIWREITVKHIYIGALVGLGELLLTGCTTTSDHYVQHVPSVQHSIDVEIKAADEIGIRFHPCRGIINRGRSKGGLPPDDLAEDMDKALKDSERIIRKYHDMKKFSMCRVALGPCSPFSVTRDALEETIKLARKYEGVLSHTHIADSKQDFDYCMKNYGVSPLKLMESTGWLGRDVWFAHAILLDKTEIGILAKTGTGVAHCPRSNMRLASDNKMDPAPVPEMLRHGVRVGLGVDGSASNDASNMLDELRTCLLVHRPAYGVSSMTATQVLEIATLGGAKILHRNEIGSIEVGKAADIVLIDLKQLGYAGAMHDPVAALLFCGDSCRVHTNIVNGEIVVEDGKLVNVDEQEICEKANELARELVDKAGKRRGKNYLKQKWIRAFK